MKHNVAAVVVHIPLASGSVADVGEREGYSDASLMASVLEFSEAMDTASESDVAAA